MYSGIPPTYPEGPDFSLSVSPNNAPIPPPKRARALSLKKLPAFFPAVAVLYWFAVVIVVCRPPWLNLFTAPPLLYAYNNSSSSSSVRGANILSPPTSNKYSMSTKSPGPPEICAIPLPPPIPISPPPPPPPTFSGGELVLRGAEDKGEISFNNTAF